MRLYWSLRSPALLQHCAPILEPHLSLLEASAGGAHCIRLPEGAENEAGPLPLGAQKGHQDLKEWLLQTAKSLEKRSVMIFLCGPEGLTGAARRAVRDAGNEWAVRWLVYQEEFRFLPGSNSSGAPVPGSALPVVEGVIVGRPRE